MNRVAALLVWAAAAVGPTSASSAVLYNVQLSGGSSALGSVSFSGDLSIDGIFPLISSDIDSFSLTITEGLNPLVITEANFRFFAGLDYRVQGGELVAFDQQTSPLPAPGCNPCQLQFGSMTAGTTSSYFAVFGSTGYQFQGNYTLSRQVASVPEPASLALLGLGIAGLAAASRRKQ